MKRINLILAVILFSAPMIFSQGVKTIDGPCVIREPGYYSVLTDISTDKIAVKIESDSVIIEANGHEIFGSRAISSSGNYTGLEIRNAILKSETSYEPTVFLKGLRDVKITGCDIYGYNLFLQDIVGCELSNNNFYNETIYYNIHARESSGLNLHDNNYYSNGDYKSFYLESVSASNFKGLDGHIVIGNSKGLRFDNCISDLIHIEFSDSIYGHDNTFLKKVVHKSTNIFLDGELSVEGSETPLNFQLAQNYPNPFNPVTTINYSLAHPGQVKLVVYNLTGQKVVTLVNKEFQPAGSHTISFNASELPSGVYFYKLQAGEFTQTKKMNLVK